MRSKFLFICSMYDSYHCLFVWFDSIHPINNLSVIKGRVFLGWTSTKLGLMFLLKDTTQWHRWGSNPQPFGLESSTLPLSHCAPIDSYHIKWQDNLPFGYSKKLSSYMSVEAILVIWSNFSFHDLWRLHMTVMTLSLTWPSSFGEYLWKCWLTGTQGSSFWLRWAIRSSWASYLQLLDYKNGKIRYFNMQTYFLHWLLVMLVCLSHTCNLKANPIQLFNIKSYHLNVYSSLTWIILSFILWIILPFVYWKLLNGHFDEHWWPRWNAAICSISSGYALFAKMKKTIFRQWNTP